MEYRLFEPDDLQLYLSWVNQKEIWEVDNSEPYQIKMIEGFKNHFDHIVSLKQSHMIILDGEKIGYIGLIQDSVKGLTPEFFIVIGEIQKQGNGYGRTAMAWLIRHAKKNRLNTLVATVLGNNLRAIQFYEKLGFVHVDKVGEPYERNGEWHHLQKYELKL